MLKSNDTDFMNKIKVMNGNYDKNNDIQVKEKIIKANMDLSYYINIKCMTLQELNEFKKNKLFEYCNSLNSVDEFTTIKDVKVNGINITRRYIIHLYSMETKDNDRYKEYAECKILKEHMDIYLEKKALLKSRKDLLFEYCNNLNSIDEFTDISNIEINGINITKTYLLHLYRMKSKNDVKYKEYTECKILKEHMDNYLANKEKKTFTLKDKWELFYKYCDKEKKVPPYTFIYDGCDIGKFYVNIRRPIQNNKDNRYIELSKYDFIKNDIDEMLEKRLKTGTFEVMANKLFEYCNKNGIPTRKTDEILFNWIREQLKRLDEETEIGKYKYNYLSQNKIVKDYLEKQKTTIRRCDKWAINYNKMKEFIEKYKRLPNRSKKNTLEERKLAHWYQEAKSRTENNKMSLEKIKSYKELNDLALKICI